MLFRGCSEDWFTRTPQKPRRWEQMSRGGSATTLGAPMEGDVTRGRSSGITAPRSNPVTLKFEDPTAAALEGTTTSHYLPESIGGNPSARGRDAVSAANCRRLNTYFSCLLFLALPPRFTPYPPPVSFFFIILLSSFCPHAVKKNTNMLFIFTRSLKDFWIHSSVLTEWFFGRLGQY